MSKEATEKSGEWLYRAVMGIFIVSMWNKVDSIAVIESRVADHERRIEKIENNVFAPSWQREARMQSLQKNLDKHIQNTTELINESDSVNKAVDVFTQPKDELLSNN